MSKTKVLRVSTPKNSKDIDTYFIAGDWHSVYSHQPSIKILLEMAKDISKKNRKLIINGDFLDLPHLMTKTLNSKKRENIIASIDDYYIPQTQIEYEWGNQTLDELEKVFSRENIIFGEGNHDWRLGHFQEYYAPREYKKFFDLKDALYINDRKYKFYNYNDWLDIGNVSITHGMYHGQTATLKHYNACGRSVIYSHVHQYAARPFTRRGDTVMSWSTPCMCTLNPEYLKNSDNNWSNGFGILNMRSNGKFNYNTIMIFDDMAVGTNGKIYT